MTALGSLWLPILVSTVLVFVVSSVIHMTPLWHKNDYPRMADEDKVIAALRPLAIPSGDYMIPRPATRKEMSSPEFTEKLRLGPVMLLTVVPNGPLAMGINLALWFVYCLVVSLLVALVAAAARPAGTSGHAIFHFAALTAFSGYVVALWQMTIWSHRSWGLTLKATADGVIYSVATGLTFACLWPQ